MVLFFHSGILERLLDLCEGIIKICGKHFAVAASRARHAKAWRKLREIVGCMWNALCTLWISPEDLLEDRISIYRTSELILEMILELQRCNGDVVDLGVEQRDDMSVGSENSQQAQELVQTDDRITLADARRITEFVAFTLRVEHQAGVYTRVVKLNDKFTSVFTFDMHV